MTEAFAVELSVVLPALDEEDGLEAVLPALKKELAALGVSHEIVVVDGGSRDATAEVARRQGARLLPQKSRGFGGAVREGLEEARGEWILVLDADGSHPAGMLPRLWERRRDHDMVIGSRYISGGSAELSWPRYALSRLLNLATGCYLGWRVRDASSGLRLYRGSAARGLSLRYPDFSVQQEALAQILAAGGTVAEVPFHFLPRLGGATKARVLPLALSYLRMLWELKRLLGASGGDRRRGDRR